MFICPNRVSYFLFVALHKYWCGLTNLAGTLCSLDDLYQILEDMGFEITRNITDKVTREDVTNGLKTRQNRRRKCYSPFFHLTQPKLYVFWKAASHAHEYNRHTIIVLPKLLPLLADITNNHKT